MTQERFRQIATQHQLWRHELLLKCRRGDLRIEEVRVLAGQMYKFTRNFVPILASILERCEDDELAVALGENLFEELGEGDASRTHPALFRRFAAAIGLDRETLENIAYFPETRLLVDTYLTMTERYGSLPAVAAVCYASEGIVAALYGQLQQGIEGAALVSPDALLFFHLHIGVDVGHARRLAEAIAPLVDDEDSAVRIEEAIALALDARCAFFDGVLREARGCWAAAA